MNHKRIVSDSYDLKMEVLVKEIRMYMKISKIKKDFE